MNDDQKQTGSLNDILKIVNRAAETFAFEVDVPSLNRKVMFRQITTGQQKRILKAIIDNPAYQTEFIFALRQIMRENCIESIEIDSLTIFDKLVITLKLRSVSISNDLDIEFTVPAKNSKPEQKIVRRINLNDLLEKVLSEIKITPLTVQDDNGIFEVFCDLPTISDEYRLEDEMRKNVSIEIKNENDLRNTVGDIYAGMLVKYIKQIKIKDGDKYVEIDLKALSFKDRLSIMGQLPTKVTKKIVDYINSVTKEFDKIVLFKEEVDGVTIEQRLKIDSSFFTPS
jgi:hypothetical protein